MRLKVDDPLNRVWKGESFNAVGVHELNDQSVWFELTVYQDDGSYRHVLINGSNLVKGE
ncbi:MAG: hypothetical protein COA63_014015 [Methylophaga sp.]|nr:hypothetical protein [Methylophaga sp.]